MKIAKKSVKRKKPAWKKKALRLRVPNVSLGEAITEERNAGEDQWKRSIQKLKLKGGPLSETVVKLRREETK